MALRIAKDILAPAQPAPKIRRRVVDGKEFVDGRHQYERGLVRPGAVVTVEVKVDGRTARTLGPWTAEALEGKNALWEVRLRVNDDVDFDRFEVE